MENQDRTHGRLIVSSNVSSKEFHLTGHRLVVGDPLIVDARIKTIRNGVRRQMISVKPGQMIELEGSLSDVLVRAAHGCEKVSLDIKKIRHPEKAYSLYGIPEQETIIAYCKGTMPLMPVTMDGVIFTNRAVYFYATLEKDLESKIRSISYTSLGHYLLTQDGQKGKVCAQTLDDEIQIYSGTLIAKNIAGSEVLQILSAIQDELCRTNTLAQRELKTLAEMILLQIHKHINSEQLPDRLSTLMECLLKKPSFADAAAMLKAEYIFRTCDVEKYQDYIKSLPDYISSDTLSKLSGIPDEFVKNYIDTLTNDSFEITYRQLSKINKHIESAEQISKPYQIIQAYINIRMMAHSDVSRLIANIRKEYGEGEANPIAWFNGFYSYCQMKKVYDTIHNQEDLSSIRTYYRDGIGLTPLHYALILKDEKAILFLLEKKGDWLTASPLPKKGKLSQFFAYPLLACGKQVTNLADVLKQTHPTVSEANKIIIQISNELKGLYLRQEMQETGLLALNMDLVKMRLNKEDSQKFEVRSIEIKEMTENIRETKMLIEQYNNALTQAERAIIPIIEAAINETLVILQEMKDSSDSFVQYLYRIYFEPDFFERVLFSVSSKADLRLYNHKGFYFLAPKFAQIDLPYWDPDYNQAENNARQANTPLYGTSWFSLEAHKDLSKLKSEFRKLAKEYHPDVSRHADCNRLFIAISAEYEDIQKELSRT